MVSNYYDKIFVHFSLRVFENPGAQNLTFIPLASYESFHFGKTVESMTLENLRLPTQSLTPS